MQRRGLQEFRPQEIVQEVVSRGTAYKETTIRTHVSSLMCMNAPDHHEIAYDDLIRVSRGRYTLA